MVALSQRLAKEAGVADKATFVQGDMFEADISKATVLALFLLPDNLTKLRDKFLDLKPGTRIVLNTFGIPDWEADVTETVDGDCASWCTSLLYIVPAKVAGTWKLPQGELALTQTFQKVTGTLTAGGKAEPIGNARLRGDQLTFTAGGTEYTGQSQRRPHRGDVNQRRQQAALDRGSSHAAKRVRSLVTENGVRPIRRLHLGRILVASAAPTSPRSVAPTARAWSR